MVTPKSEIPFTYVEKTFLSVPVIINGTITRNFIFDTGAGVNVISKSLCEEISCKITGNHKGKRMSGQEISVPLSAVKSLKLGQLELENVSVGVFDMDALMPGTNISGIISLGFFENNSVTVDYKRNLLKIEDEDSLSKVRNSGVSVPVKLDKDGPSVGIVMPLVLPNGKTISAEVDTGSQALILNLPFMDNLAISKNDPKVTKREGKDETGHTYARYFTKLETPVHLPGHPEMRVSPINVMFQEIIYDGLIGHYFLEKFQVTYNLPGREMIFRRP